MGREIEKRLKDVILLVFTAFCSGWCWALFFSTPRNWGVDWIPFMMTALMAIYLLRFILTPDKGASDG